MQFNIVLTENDLRIFRIMTSLYLPVFTVLCARRRELQAQDTQSTTTTSVGSPTDHIRPPGQSGFLYDRKTDGQESFAYT